MGIYHNNLMDLNILSCEICQKSLERWIVSNIIPCNHKKKKIHCTIIISECSSDQQ